MRGGGGHNVAFQTADDDLPLSPLPLGAGPVVTCGHCGQAFETGQKFRAVLAELVLPTFLGQNIIYYFIFLALALLLGLGAGDTAVLRTAGLVVLALVTGGIAAGVGCLMHVVF